MDDNTAVETLLLQRFYTLPVEERLFNAVPLSHSVAEVTDISRGDNSRSEYPFLRGRRVRMIWGGTDLVYISALLSFESLVRRLRTQY